MQKCQAQPSSGADVLVLDADRAEWLHVDGNGRSSLGSVAIAGPAPVDVAAAALAAREAAGSSARRIVLALDPSMAGMRLLTTPELSRANLAAVLGRKAAAIAGCDGDDVLYAATHCGEEGDSTPGAKREVRWSVVALRRSRMREILLALRRRDITVVRVVSTQLSIPTRALELAGPGDDAIIVVGVDRRAVHVALIGGGALAMQNTLEGNFHEQPTLALGLLQEVRGIEAYWRKQSRGGQVGRVVLIGLEGERSQLLATALTTAIQGARIVRETHAHHDDPVLAGRIGIISCARSQGGFQVDLTLPIPAPPVAIAVMAGAFLACVGVAGVVGYAHTNGREVEARAELSRLSLAAVDLEVLEAREAEARVRLAELGALTERNAAVLSDGWPIEELLADCLSACGPDAALTLLRAGRWDRSRDVSFEALTSAHLFAAMQRIARVRTKLEASPLIALDAEEARGEPSEGLEGFSFAFEAHSESEP